MHLLQDFKNKFEIEDFVRRKWKDEARFDFQTRLRTIVFRNVMHARITALLK